MNRRQFLLGLCGLVPSFGAIRGRAEALPSVVLQESPVAGFQFHRGEAVWPRLRVGAPLTLRREPTNPHDSRAVAVYLGADQIGYVPRRENLAIATLLDQGVRLQARVTRLRTTPDPWERVRFEVRLG